MFPSPSSLGLPTGADVCSRICFMTFKFHVAWVVSYKTYGELETEILTQENICLNTFFHMAMLTHSLRLELEAGHERTRVM